MNLKRQLEIIADDPYGRGIPRFRLVTSGFFVK